MKGRAPFGFWVAGACSGWFCLAMVMAVCMADPAYDGGWMVERGVGAVLAVLSAVVTEALWRARPWVWRASLALAVAFSVGLLVMLRRDMEEALGLLLASMVVVVPLLAYIRSRAKVMWPKQPPQPAAPIAVPRPGGRP
jgi:hypothetical protein